MVGLNATVNPPAMVDSDTISFRTGSGTGARTAAP